MIEDKFVDLYARNSGLRDKLVAERLRAEIREHVEGERSPPQDPSEAS